MADLKGSRSSSWTRPERRCSIRGRARPEPDTFRALAHDDRPWGGTAPPRVAFTYVPGRGWAACRTDPAGVWRHALQVDGYAGYNRLIAPDRVGPGIQLAYCWAHARRKLIEITRTGPAPIAKEGVDLIRDLYRIEAEVSGLDPLVRLAAQQDRSAPILACFDDWLRHHRSRVSTKSLLGEARACIAKYPRRPWPLPDRWRH